MGKNKAVTFGIFFIILFVLILFPGASAALTCTSGTVDTICYLNSTYTFAEGEVISGLGDLVIQDRGSIANYSRAVSNHGSSVVLNFSTITILTGGNISGGNVTIYASNLSLINGIIYAEGLGYSSTFGPGVGGNAADYGGGGAGHGGNGGRGYYNGYKGAAGISYGSSFMPKTFGSGGGKTVAQASAGGAGGGIISIFLSDTFLLNGTLDSDGAIGLYRSGGGGSGGSIYVETKILSGLGNVVARGGNGIGTIGDGVTFSGGGSGGRVAIYYNQSMFTNFYNSSVNGGASGGSAAEAGWRGTMVFIDKDDNSAILTSGFKFQGATTVANESTNTTFWNSANPNWYNFSSLSLIGAYVISNSLFPINVSAKNISIDINSSIDVSGKGYAGQSGPGAGGNAADWGGAGGGHGGRGGRGYYQSLKSSSGIIYGSSLMPTTFGSGGGRSLSDGNSVGGFGGGVVILSVENNFLMNGNISANGAAGLYRDGGGSGGSIYINTYNFSGLGRLRSNGGNGWGDVVAGAGGAGGRIAVYYNESSFINMNVSTVSAGLKGSAGGEDGDRGSLIFFDQDNNSVILSDGFRFQGLTGTANETTTSNLSFWNSANPGFYNFTNLTILSGTQVFQETSINLSYIYHQFVNFSWKCYGSNYWNSNFYIVYPTLIILNISSSNLSLDQNSIIDLSSCGYSYSSGPGTSGTCQANSCGGASHGGYGGRGSNTNTYWPIPGYPYGSSLAPNTFGSGARGPAAGYPGGRGGGVLLITLSDTLTLEGDLKVNGETGISNDGIQGSGGGAGGSIYARIKNLAGAGRFLAVGGNGADFGNYEGGGGSGGRIAVYYNNSIFYQLASSVAGGTGGNFGSEAGGRGSLIFVDEDNNSATITQSFRFQGNSTVANESTNTTFWNSANPSLYNFTSLNILSGSQVFQATSMTLTYLNHSFNNFNWSCYGRNFLNANYFIVYPTLISLYILADNLNLDSTSNIDLSYCGYAGSTGLGTPASCAANACGGASHGGIGGRGSNNGALTTVPPIAYGSYKMPSAFGSGGGTATGTNPGGRGGGVIKLDIFNTLNLSGSLKTNGELGLSDTSIQGSGGGSGGSIYVRAKNLVGNGNIASTGGNGYDGGSYEGGGGSGGRIFVFYGNSTFNFLNISVLGGTGGNFGTPAERGANGTTVYTSMPIISQLNLSTTNSSLNDTFQNFTVNLISSDVGNEDTTYVYNWYKNNVLNATTLITDGLVAYYPLDNNSLDYYNGNNGTSTNPLVVPGKIKNAFNFDGVSSKIDVTPMNLSTTAGISFSFWANASSMANTESFFQYGLDPGVNQNFLRLGFHDDGGVNKLRLWTQTGTAAYDHLYSINVADIAPGWNHYYVEWSATTKKLYINGAQVPLIVWQRTSPTLLSNLNTTQFLRLGYALVGASSYYFDGQLDEFASYNRTLSEDEIGRLYRAGAYGGNLLNANQTLWNESWSVGVIPADFNGLGLEVRSSRIRVEDLTPSNGTPILPVNNTYFNNGTNINFTANISDESSGIRNITLNIYNQTTLVNQTSINYSTGVLTTTVGIVVSLVEGVYSWFYSIFDWAGNMFSIQNSTITNDFTLPIINFVYPTPTNDTGKSSFFEINATIYEINLANVSLHFNGSIRSFNRSYENLTYMGNNLWNIFLTQGNLTIGQSYSYYLSAEDYATNTNFSEVRKVNGNTAPNITAITQYPNSSDLIDPNTEIFITANVTDLDDNFDFATLELRNGSGYLVESKVMDIASGNSSAAYLNASVTLPSQEGEYSYRIRTIDTLGDFAYTINYTLSSFWDCSWVIETSGLEGAQAYGYYQDKLIGNITIINTGNVNYGVNNCNITFTNSYSRNTFSGNYWTSSNWYSSKSGLQFSDESFSLLPGENRTFNVFASFPAARLEETPLISIVSDINSSLSGNSTSILQVKMTMAPPGPYLRQGFLENDQSVYLTNAINSTFSAYLENVAGNGSAINSAYNVSFNWNLSNSLEVVDGFSSIFYENLSNSSRLVQNVIVNFDSALLAGLSETAQNISIFSNGYKNESGNFTEIINANNKSLLEDNLSINFVCYPIKDNICVESCMNISAGLVFDPDCVIPSETVVIVVPGAGGGGGGGGGGGAGSLSEKSDATFELLSGKEQEFTLRIDNKLESDKRNINVSVSGINQEYLSFAKTIKLIPAKDYVELKVKITAPAYFTQGKYVLKFNFAGDIMGNTTTKYTETKTVTLYITELTRVTADIMLNESFDFVTQMNESGMILKDVEAYLASMNSSYNDVNFLSVRENFNKLKQIYTAAFEAKKLIEEMNKSIIEAEYNGIDVLRTKKLFYTALVIYQRGDYLLALSKLQETRSSYLYEAKGEYNVLVQIKNNPLQSFGIFLLISGAGVVLTLATKYRIYKNRIKLLGEEEQLLLQLMKTVQRECFERNKMSMEEYEEAMIQYEKKLGEAIEDRITAETKLANLLNLKGKSVALNQEKTRLISLMKTLQSDYLVKGKIETRIYDNMLKTYSTRLSKVEEELVFIEANEAIAKSK